MEILDLSPVEKESLCKFACGRSSEFLIKPAVSELSCVRLVVEDLDEDAAHYGITQDGLKTALLVALRSKLPRLKIDDATSCRPSIYVNVSFIETHSNGRVTGWAAVVRLQLLQLVNVLENGAQTSAPVWQDLGTLGVGPPESAKSWVLGTLDDLITKFAAAYYEAKNE